MPDPMHFDAVAATYDDARPPYPPALWARLRELEVLAPGARLLDLGAGSGQATQVMYDEGAVVTAVEPGPALAALLAERLPAVELRVASVEDVDLPEATYDAAVAATAFHWFDADRVLPRLRRALRPDGRLAAWWNVYGPPGDVEPTPFRAEVGRIAAARTRRGHRDRPSFLDTDAWSARVTSTGDFAVTHTEVFRWTVDLTTAQVAALFGTFSDWSETEVGRVAGWVADHGGVVREHYATVLLVGLLVGPRSPSRPDARDPRLSVPPGSIEHAVDVG